ncbi:hypothetical protein BDR06DRAFT_974263 [Suillus hirtellus]|nr:hypothetical protein BDR06DRAFT_974263 [Suillus hirtellus]
MDGHERKQAADDAAQYKCEQSKIHLAHDKKCDHAGSIGIMPSADNGKVSWNLNLLPSDVVQVFCNASSTGLSFWYLALNLGFQSPLPSHSPVEDIFFYESLCVSSAIHDAVTHVQPDGRLVVFTDSLNTVFMFNSLAGPSGYNHLLMDTVEVILAFKIDF